MIWAGRPRRIHEGVMEVLLDVIDDLADVPRRNVGKQSAPRGRFDDRSVMSRADGGLDVGANKRNDASLILGGYSARCLTSLALYRTRLTRRHAILHDPMIAAEDAAAEDARAPASCGRFTATGRAREFQWNGEHLSAPDDESARHNRRDVSCVRQQDIKGARDQGRMLAALAAGRRSLFCGSPMPCARTSAQGWCPCGPRASSPRRRRTCGRPAGRRNASTHCASSALSTFCRRR